MFLVKAMDNNVVVMTPFGDIVAINLVVNSYVLGFYKVAKGNDKI